jgi:hypothetical protein
VASTRRYEPTTILPARSPATIYGSLLAAVPRFLISFCTALATESARAASALSPFCRMASAVPA